MMDCESMSNEEISLFIVITCQLIPKAFAPVTDEMHNLIVTTSYAPKEYIIRCGSLAEFYIRPLHACVDDNDSLLCRTDELASIGDCPVLPSDMTCLADTIKCYKIESYEGYPGFARLRVLGEMNYDWKNKKYEFKHAALTKCYKTLNMASVATEYFPRTHNTGKFTNDVIGPAIKYEYDIVYDVVPCVWCPRWPREAKGWLNRPRDHGWPTVDTVSEIVENGCHVVYVQHRSCRDDVHQWRLSFSVAEVILLQSMSDVQQIVYHLLRFVAKRELIQTNCPKEDEILCTYHLKTLILWTCEEKPPEWWDSSSIIKILCDLLQKLSEWLKRKYFPNYFIPEANLFHEPSRSTMLDKTERRINDFLDSVVIGRWFMDNYLLPITHTGVSKIVRKETSISMICTSLDEFREAEKSRSLDLLFAFRFRYSHESGRFVVKHGLTSGLRQCLKFKISTGSFDAQQHSENPHIPTVENVLSLSYYDNLLYILHVSYGLYCGEISWDSKLLFEFIEAVSIKPKIVRSQYHNFPKAYTASDRPTLIQFVRAQNLMRHITGSNSRSEFQLLSLLANLHLRSALKYDDSIATGVAPAAWAYLAALHFYTLEYQQVLDIRLCLAVFQSQSSLEKKETLNAGSLLFIDDIARIVGLTVLYKIAGNNAHYVCRRLYLDLRLSPEVFVHYLFVLSVQRMHIHLNHDHPLPDPLYAMDTYFITLINSKCFPSMKFDPHLNAARIDSLSTTDATDTFWVNETVIYLLMEYALENMTSFYSTIRRDFDIQCNTADCYRALYLYKCHKYDEMKNLCERILQEPDLQSQLHEFGLANVLVLPPVDTFFDRDVQSLLGFHTLCHYVSPQNDDMRNCDSTAEVTFATFFGHKVCFHKQELSTSLEERYSIKRHYFLGRHFLARYLKVR